MDKIAKAHKEITGLLFDRLPDFATNDFETRWAECEALGWAIVKRQGEEHEADLATAQAQVAVMVEALELCEPILEGAQRDFTWAKDARTMVRTARAAWRAVKKALSAAPKVVWSGKMPMWRGVSTHPKGLLTRPKGVGIPDLPTYLIGQQANVIVLDKQGEGQ